MPGRARQRAGVAAHQRPQVALELADLRGQLEDAGEQLAADAQQDARRLLGEAALESIEDLQVVQRAPRELDRRVELEQQPADAGLVARALDHQDGAVVEQQRDLTLRSRQLRDRQVRLSERGARDRKRVDRVALAERPRALARARHHLRRHPNDPLASLQQRRLEVPREVAAVLDRPLALDVQAVGEAQQLPIAVTVGRDRLLGQLPARRGVDGHHGVRAHMRVDPDHDHQPALPCSTTSTRTAGGQHIVKAKMASLLSSHASNPPTRRAT